MLTLEALVGLRAFYPLGTGWFPGHGVRLRDRPYLTSLAEPVVRVSPPPYPPGVLQGSSWGSLEMEVT